MQYEVTQNCGTEPALSNEYRGKEGYGKHKKLFEE